MIQKTMKLPEIEFVGGETKTFCFDLRTESGEPYKNIDGCIVNFSIIHYANREFGSPVVDLTLGDNNGQVSVLAGTEGYNNCISVRLKPSDTIHLSGKFIYQIIARSVDGLETSIPGQGTMMITKNINPNYILS